eukprot:TRINITY_DN16644_c0_g1_i1.p1 TRINITY_DN16644_c0_g1~~TRINITY_DN16644_c0_g1_i1.p1  ORF type:complete len:202 (+),score=22.71 TRINITY_DN16644_c0_g1_i1:81-608(+)
MAMVGGRGQTTERGNIAEESTAVEAMEREKNDRAGKRQGQAKGGYSSLDLEDDGPDVKSVPSLNSDCSTLAPRPPPKRRPAGGKNFRQKFQSAPLPDNSLEITTQQDGIDPLTESAVPHSRPSGRAPTRLRARILHAQVQEHRSQTLNDFEPIDLLSEVDEPISELSDTEGEESG